MRVGSRFILGFYAGAIAGAVKSGVHGLLCKAIRNGGITYHDWASRIVYGHRPHGIIETLVSTVVEVFFCGALGVMFSYLLPFIGGTRDIRLKGLVYGLAVSFVADAVFRLYNVSGFTHSSTMSGVSFLLSAMAFGLVLAWEIRWLYRRYDLLE